MKKKHNKLGSKRIKNIVGAALLASVFLSLTAFTPVGSKSTVLASKNTSKSKEGSTAWDNLVGKSGKDSKKTFAEENKFEFVDPKETLTQVGFLTLADESGNFIQNKNPGPKTGKKIVKRQNFSRLSKFKQAIYRATICF